MIGDDAVQRADSVEAGWAVVQPVLDLWKTTKRASRIYPAGTAGPTPPSSCCGAAAQVAPDRLTGSRR